MKKSLVAMLLLTVLSTVYSQVPRYINYQGVLRNSQNEVINDTKNITLKIMEIGSNTTVYQQSYNVNVKDGIVNLQLGPIPANILFDEEYNIAVFVEGNELLPRTKILSVPYALYSNTSENVVNAVQSLNGINGKVNIAGLGGATVTKSKDTIYITATGGSGAGVQSIQNTDSTIKITNPSGPAVIIGIADSAVSTAKIRNGSITLEKLSPNIVLPLTAKAGGSLTGYYPNPGIAVDSVKSEQIIKNAVGDEELQEQVHFGNEQVFIGIDKDSAGVIYLGGTNKDYYNTKLVNHDGGLSGAIELYNDGYEIVTIGTSQAGSGGIWVTGKNGSPNAYISHADGYPNEGAVLLFNDEGTLNLGIYGNGDFWANGTKSFIVNDPTDNTRKIKYTCLEGPEAAMYFRGKARLADGRATIELPDYFRSLASDSTITVSLTPHSLSSKGMAVDKIGNGTVTVGELFEGTGNYEFSYTVYAVRKGYENYEVYINKDDFQRKYNNVSKQPLPHSVRIDNNNCTK